MPPPKIPRFVVPNSTPSSTPTRPPRFLVPRPTSPSSRRVPKFLNPSSTPTPSATSTPTPTPSRPAFLSSTPQKAEEVIDDEDDFAAAVSRRRKRRRSSEGLEGDEGDSQEVGLESPTAHRSTRALPFAPGSTQSAAVGAPISTRLFALRLPEGDGEVQAPVDWSPTKPKRGKGGHVPGGLAATVAGWVVDARNAQGRRRGAVYRVREGRPGEGFVSVMTEEGGLVLVRRAGAGEVGVGVRIKVEWPWWEVGVEGRIWRVCVFWEVVGEEEEEEVLV